MSAPKPVNALFPDLGGLPQAQLTPKALAFLGDSVYSLYVRAWLIRACSGRTGRSLNDWHRLTTRLVQAPFQASLVQGLMPDLTELEQDWVRRGRNIPLAAKRRGDQQAHRLATGFETLVGYLYASDQPRLAALWTLAEPFLLGALGLDAPPPVDEGGGGIGASR